MYLSNLCSFVACAQRKETLLVEFKNRDKVNRLVDRRFGEEDAAMTVEDKMLQRFAMERQVGGRGGIGEERKGETGGGRERDRTGHGVGTGLIKAGRGGGGRVKEEAGGRGERWGKERDVGSTSVS